MSLWGGEIPEVLIRWHLPLGTSFHYQNKANVLVFLTEAVVLWMIPRHHALLTKDYNRLPGSSHNTYFVRIYSHIVTQDDLSDNHGTCTDIAGVHSSVGV